MVGEEGLKIRGIYDVRRKGNLYYDKRLQIQILPVEKYEPSQSQRLIKKVKQVTVLISC